MMRTGYPGYFVFFLISMSLNEFVVGQEASTATIQEEHKSFYRVNSEIDFNAILKLHNYYVESNCKQ